MLDCAPHEIDQSSKHVDIHPVELIIGPMFSGKTTELKRRVMRYILAKKSAIIIKWTGDTRTIGSKIATHDGHEYPAVEVNGLDQVSQQILDENHVIGIDEGQFLVDLDMYVRRWRKLGKIVIVAALNGDSSQKCFGKVPKLMPISDITTLKAVCVKCGKEALYSHRLCQDEEQQCIGGTDKFESLCDGCYEVATISNTKK